MPLPRCPLSPLFALGISSASIAQPSTAAASSFAGRLSLGPTYLQNDSTANYGDSSGPGLSAQLDAGLQLSAPLIAHATLIYDYSRWLELKDYRAGPYDGSMLGLGLGATLRVAALSVGAAVGAQFTFFPTNDDPSSGPNGAGLGPFIAFSGGHVWTIEGATNAGVHGVFRYRQSKDETNSIVYDPKGYHLGLMLSIGLDGDPLLAP